MRKTNFIYIDESITDDANLASLTGLIVPYKVHYKIKKDFYKVISMIINHIYPDRDENQIISPPLLHTNDFLQNCNENKSFDFSSVTDEFRYEIMEKLLDIVDHYKLKIVRFGYSNYTEIKQQNIKDDKLYHLNWMALSKYLDTNYKKSTKHICIMDGDNREMMNSISKRLWDHTYLTELYPITSNSLHLQNPERFIGNVFYTPARYSEFIQLVDLYSYLLQKKDFASITGKSSPYIDKQVEIISKLNKKRVVNSVIKMRFENNGV